MKKIIELVIQIFPDANPALISESTLLSQIPGWDSLSSISFEMIISHEFRVNIRGLALGPDLSLADVAAHIRNRGASI